MNTKLVIGIGLLVTFGLLLAYWFVGKLSDQTFAVMMGAATLVMVMFVLHRSQPADF